jgi:hypothetical protein
MSTPGSLPAAIECVEDARVVLAHFDIACVWLQEITGQDNTYVAYIDASLEWTPKRVASYHAARAHFDASEGKKVVFAEKQ